MLRASRGMLVFGTWSVCLIFISFALHVRVTLKDVRHLLLGLHSGSWNACGRALKFLSQQKWSYSILPAWPFCYVAVNQGDPPRHYLFQRCVNLYPHKNLLVWSSLCMGHCHPKAPNIQSFICISLFMLFYLHCYNYFLSTIRWLCRVHDATYALPYGRWCTMSCR